MSRRLLIVPTLGGSGGTAVCLGLVHALDVRGMRVGYVKPMMQPHQGKRGDNATDLIRLVTALDPPAPVPAQTLRDHLSRNSLDDLMEQVLSDADHILTDNDFVVVEGLAPTPALVQANRVNEKLAATLDASVILVVDGRSGAVKSAETAAAAAGNFQSGENNRVIGVIVNRVPQPGATTGFLPVEHGQEPGANAETRATDTEDDYRAELQSRGLTLIAAIAERPEINYPRVGDVVGQLELKVLNAGELDRRVERCIVAAQAVPGVIDGLREGALVVVPGDRSEIVLLASLMTMNNVRFAGLLLTVGIEPDPRLMQLCAPAAAAGLPILVSPEFTYETVNQVDALDPDIPIDDEERTRAVTEHVTAALSEEWVQSLADYTERRRLSPAAFRRQLTTLAAAADKRIVLPEGAEPRTVQAAVICHRKKIARCVLLAPPDEVRAVASSVGVALPSDLEIIDPATIVDDYVDALVERRGHKGMTAVRAAEELVDPVMLGTMMVHLDAVDGLVSGAVHTTANTVRPALQVLGTKPDTSLVSSVFFMLLPDEVVLYGDCAINPDPDAAQLADIAIESANSAVAFGIDPKVAMISFSTGSSGSGADVAKVSEATDLVRQRRPDIVIDGPLQYDAASMASVAASKAPDSPVAGQATVFVFPDLNTGNTTYKAVQRSAGVISVGPMLQGIAKPVNDLSRGALVDDIVYTIALTAIQAANL